MLQSRLAAGSLEFLVTPLQFDAIYQGPYKGVKHEEAPCPKSRIILDHASCRDRAKVV